ncbi:MAG TPA: hypothetical protein VF265_01360 [Nevskiaceae bacterium]
MQGGDCPLRLVAPRGSVSATFQRGVAVLGAGDLVGEEVLRLLAAGGEPFPHVHALDVGAAVGEPVDYGDARLVVEDAMAFEYAHAGVVLSSVDRATAARCLPIARSAGCLIVDASGLFRADPHALTVVIGVNPEALERLTSLPGEVVMTPGHAVVQALRVLVPLQQRFGLRRVNLLVCHPAARSGKAGVERLARESAHALNGHGLEHTHPHAEPRGVVRAFGVTTLAAAATNGDDEIATLARQLVELLGQTELDVRVTELVIPVFYDCTLAFDLELEESVDAVGVRDALASTGGVDVGVEGSASEVDSGLHVSSAADGTSLRLQWLEAPRAGGKLSLGTTGDAIRCGSAAEQVGILRHLLGMGRQG